MTGTPLVIGEDERSARAKLRDHAALHPVEMQGLFERLQSPAHKRLHMDQMNRQSVQLPFGFWVTYSIETGHPIGTCRHMSMSSPARGRAPTPEAIDMVAEILGFVGGYRLCTCWLEDLQRGNAKQQAVNLVQPLTVAEGQA